MFGMPETPIIEGNEKGKLIASISITREPEGCEPFIAFQYEVSLRVFGIALALAKMEGSLNKGIIEQQTQAQNNQSNNQSNNENNEGHEDYSEVSKENINTDSCTDDTDDNGGKSLAGRKKRKYGTA